MDSPFIYDKYVTGKNFIGRRSECRILGNLLSQGEHVCIYEPPKSGKMSMIQQTLFDLRIKGQQFLVANLSLINVRHTATFLTRLGTVLLRSVASTPAEFADLIDRHLAGTHFVFDGKSYADADQVISLNWDIDQDDILAMLRLPWKLAREKGQPLFCILDEFQNLDQTEDGERLYKALETVIAEQAQESRPGCSLVLCGSMVNAMKEIFEVRRFFYRQVDHFPIGTAEEKEIIEHVVRGFLSGGKVIERELLLGMCRLFRNNLWYINHFVAICDAKSKGYIVEATLMEALRTLISIHEPRFQSIVNNLTTFQLNLIKAILDGHGKFSASGVIQQYDLNSSANVKRVKDALMKKEIITFNDKDEPMFLDPLFAYWLRRYFFEMPD